MRNKSSRDPLAALGRREREIMNVVFRLGRATVADVLAHLDEPPSYSSVRTMLRYLEAKEFLRHEVAGRSYVYVPTARRSQAQRSALSSLVQTFFDGSRAQAIAALLGVEKSELTDADLRRLRDLVSEPWPGRPRGE
jgi:predicted transcriptional regulator